MENQLQNIRNQIVQANMPALPQEISFPSEIGLGSEDLLRMKEQSEKSKKRSGYFLLFIITLLFITANVLNALYIRNGRAVLWSIIVYLTFLLPILFTKFDLMEKIINRFTPFLKEPEDFIKRVREKRQTEIGFQQSATS